MATQKSQGMGSDTCPKCGSADITRLAVVLGNLLTCTCKTCGSVFTLGALDTPTP